jgi:hypothetical protein
MWDRIGQLGESREYHMGRVRVVYFHIRSSECGSPHLCWLSIDHLARWARLIMYWRIQDLWGPANLVASLVAELDDTPPYFTSDIGIVWGPPMDVCQGIAWKTCTRVRWARLNSLIVIVNYGHSWCLCGSCVSCCQVVTLQGYIDSNLYDTLGYGWCLLAAVISYNCKLHDVHMRIMLMMWLLGSQRNDNKICWLSYLACLA